MKQTKEWALVLAALVLLAMPADAARGGARGGGMGGRGGSPSISRPAGNPGSQKIDISGISKEKRMAAPQNGPGTGSGASQGQTSQGQQGTAAGNGASAPANIRSGFFGGGGFFNGFSLWPWMWFAGHNSSSANGEDNKEPPQEESFGDMLARWEQNVDQFFLSIFRWLGLENL